MKGIQAGSIFACYGTDYVSRLISLGTASTILYPHIGPSHVAIAADYDGRGLHWFETTSMCPSKCLYHGDYKYGAQVHHIERRIEDYTSKGGKVYVYNPNEYFELDEQQSARLAKMMYKFLVNETVYDTTGAIFSASRVAQLLPTFPNSGIDDLFCSEQLAFVLQCLCLKNKSNPSRYNPGRLLREILYHSVYYVDTVYTKEGSKCLVG